MKLATLRIDGSTRAAVLLDGSAVLLDAAGVGDLLSRGDWRGRAEAAIADLDPDRLDPERVVPESEWALAPLIPRPGKIFCVGLNYAAHIDEMGHDRPDVPTLFAKFADALAGPRDDLMVHADAADALDYEGELAVVIGQPCRDVAAARAHEVILGYTCANDVTARDQQLSDGQWTRGKGYDTFCPLGPWIVTDLDPNGLDVRVTLTHPDGTSEVRQDGNTSQFMHTVGEIVEYVSRVMTLLPGDVILTGTPAGVGPMLPGDRVTVEIEGIGSLTNPVVDR